MYGLFVVSLEVLIIKKGSVYVWEAGCKAIESKTENEKILVELFVFLLPRASLASKGRPATRYSELPSTCVRTLCQHVYQ